MFLTGRDDELLARLRREMSEASETRRYETAAQRRDQIHLLERVRMPQDVVVSGGREIDVLGHARLRGRVAVAMLILRQGRIVGKESRILHDAGAADDAAVMASFLAQHYLAQAAVPRRIVVGVEPTDATVLAAALESHAGHKVSLRVAQRGRGARLVRSAERNAALALEDLEARIAGRRARFSPEILELQRLLALPDPPYRMVCFDVSNLGHEGAVAAIVASENGIARKGLYRRMRIRHPGPDDFAMIREAVTRYWARIESGEIPRPDLVVVDGGPGQVSAARAALDAIASRPTPLIGLAKREETIVREHGPGLRLPRRSPALRALQRLRDEAHRFGLTYHRGLRSRSRLASELDDVPGVGPARRAAMLKEFGSVAALRAASPEDISRRARVPIALAARVAAALRTEGAA
jgi:excinuclease ABC subunit C